MSSDSEKLLAALKAFEQVCGKALHEVRHQSSMRQAMDAAKVKLPGELRGAGHGPLMGYRRLARTLSNRLDELLRLQLEDASRIRDHWLLEREIDRLKSREWYALRTEYPELYSKALSQSSALLRRAQAH